MRPPRSQKGERRGNCATDRGTFPLFFAEAGVVRGEIWPSGFIFFAVSARNHILQRFLTHLLLIGPERSRGKPKGRFVFSSPSAAPSRAPIITVSTRIHIARGLIGPRVPRDSQ